MESNNVARSESRESSVAAMLGTAAVMAISALIGLVPLALMVIGGYTVIRWIFG
ncbi:MAG: hypothetical protein JNM94_08190 [Phycisphaerae bacterium]|nr:hypothetical protein [Phycisphaerae bacterium]